MRLLESSLGCLSQGAGWRSRSSAKICFDLVLLIVGNATRHNVNTLEVSPRNRVR